MKKKAKTLLLASGFAIVALGAATFAWFTSEDEVVNKFEGQIATGKDTEVIETFDPPKEWMPGAEVNKDVTLNNTGQYDTLVRITLKESLELLQDHQAYQTDGKELEGKQDSEVFVLPASVSTTGYTDSKFDGAAPTLKVATGHYAGTYTLKVKEKKETVNGKTIYSYRYTLDNGTKSYHASGINGFSRNANDEIKVNGGAPALNFVSLDYKPAEKGDWRNTPIYTPTFTADATGALWTAPATLGSTHITIIFNNLTNDPKVPNKWYYNAADGYFYYTTVVKSGATTTQFMDAVMLSGNAGNEFSKLKYELTVVAQGISAFKSAVDQWITPGTNDALANVLKAQVPEK